MKSPSDSTFSLDLITAVDVRTVWLRHRSAEFAVVRKRLKPATGATRQRKR